MIYMALVHDKFIDTIEAICYAREERNFNNALSIACNSARRGYSQS